MGRLTQKNSLIKIFVISSGEEPKMGREVHVMGTGRGAEQ